MGTVVELQSHRRSVKRTPDGYVWMSGFTAHCVNDDSIEDCVKTVLDQLIGKDFAFFILLFQSVVHNNIIS